MNKHTKQQSRRSIVDDADDASQSDDDDDYNKLGEKLSRATKFLGTIVKGKGSDDELHDLNHDVDRYRRSVGSAGEEKNEKVIAALNDRYNEANEGNLYKCLRSVRHTNSDGMGTSPTGGMGHDEMSFASDDDASDMSMPRIDEGESDDDHDDDDGVDSRQSDPGEGEGPPDFVPARHLPRRASDTGMRRNANGRRGSTESGDSATHRRERLHRQPSDISTHSIPSIPDDAKNERFNRRATRESLGGSGTPRLLRAIGLGREGSDKSIMSDREQTRRSSTTRRSSAMSTATEESGETNVRRWFGWGGGVSKSFRGSNRCLQKNALEGDDANDTPNNAHLGGSFTSGTSATTSAVADTKLLNSSFTDHHAKSRANFTKRHVSHAARDNASFRTLQKRMKEKGAITASSVQHMLQEAAEEHALVSNDGPGMAGGERGELLASDSELGCLDESESFRRPQQPLTDSNNGNTAEPLQTSAVQGRAGTQQLDEQRRLDQDPLFGKSKDGSASSIRPYITIPSRESQCEQIIDDMRQAADQGQSRLIAVDGERFVGKTRLLRHAIDTVQIQGLGYTVLASSRSRNDALASFFAFRDIVSGALRACDAVTRRSDYEACDENECKSDKEGEGCDELSVIQRLVQRKILNKSDRLMIGRILPAVMNNQLLSLLKERNPAALMKDIGASLFKILIPLQPVMLLLEADGDDCDIDPSSWDLIRELLSSADKQCPQMAVIAVSRHPLTGSIPASIFDDDQRHREYIVEPMTREDTECYIRALFCDPSCIDRNMMVDSHVVDGVYERARGCPLFTERIILWAQRKEVIELDETRNAVALNLLQVPNHHEIHCQDTAKSSTETASLLDTLPSNLNEELLEVINNLPHGLLDALKVAASLGITFDLNNYKSLQDELHAHLQEVTSSHGIFDYEENDNDGSCLYRWKHVAVYEAVVSIIISNERIEIQNRIADSLQAGDSNSGDTSIDDDGQCYARHYLLAERWDEAFDRFMEAGSNAEKRLDFVGAVGFYEQAKACLAKSHKRPSLQRRLSPHAALGWCLRELVRYEEAEKELEFCLKQTEAVPKRKRNTQWEEIELDVITTLATLKQAQSKYSEAMELYESALPTARAKKEKHSRVWLAHHVASCAEIHRKAGDLEQAKSLHTEALGYRESAVEERSCTILELALSFTQLGCTLSGLGDHSAAYDLHRKALAKRVEHLDYYHSLVSESLNYCADALQALGRGNEGIPLAMHAVKIRKFVFGPSHPAYAHALSVLASCFHSVGRSFDSLGLMKECLEICENAFSANHANLIPNLTLYGSVLTVAGNMEEAKAIYERALDIHKINFTEGQNAQQLQKLQDAMKDLDADSNRSVNSDQQPQPQQTKAASLEMPIPPFEADSAKTHVIVCADIGQRASDEFMLSMAASLQSMGNLKLMSVIAVSSPQVVRADIARGALDSLLLSYVPVAYSGVVSDTPSGGKLTSDGKSASGAATITFNADYGKPSAHVNNTGIELITRALLLAPEKSLVLMCTVCLGDVSKVIDTHRDLFARKVKQVVVIGSVKSLRRKSYIEPEDSCDGSGRDAYARNVYQRCQDLQVPTVTLSKDVARGFPFPSSYVDDLASSNHMVAAKVQRSEEMHMNGMWELVKQLQQEPRSYRTPKSVDVKSFHKYSLGGKKSSGNVGSIWPLVQSINLELVLGLLACLPMYRDSHFRWETHTVNGVEHRVCRHTNAAAGIIKPEALANEAHMLIGFALRTSLLNTSC